MTLNEAIETLRNIDTDTKTMKAINKAIEIMKEKQILIYTKLLALLMLMGCTQIGDDIAVFSLDCKDSEIQAMVVDDATVNTAKFYVNGDTIRTDTFNFYCDKEPILKIHRTANRFKTEKREKKGEKFISMTNSSGQPYKIILNKKRIDYTWTIYSAYGEWYVVDEDNTPDKPDTLNFTYDYEGSLNHGEEITGIPWNVRTETLDDNEESYARIAVLAATFNKFKSTSAVGTWNSVTQRYEDGPVSLTEKKDSTGNYWLYKRNGKVWGEWLSEKKYISYATDKKGDIFSRSNLFLNKKTVITEYLPNNAESYAKIRALATTFDKAHSRQASQGWRWVESESRYRKGSEALVKKTDSQGIYWLHIKNGKVRGQWVTGKRKDFDGDVS